MNQEEIYLNEIEAELSYTENEELFNISYEASRDLLKKPRNKNKGKSGNKTKIKNEE